MRSHNGEVRVDSVVNHGTTVTLTLPIRQEEASDSKKEEDSEIVGVSRSRVSGLKVLGTVFQSAPEPKTQSQDPRPKT
jgi:hypothetical protein